MSVTTMTWILFGKRCGSLIGVPALMVGCSTLEYGTFEELMALRGEFYRMKMIQS